MDPQQPPAPLPPSPWARPAEEVGPAPGVRFAGHGARLAAYIVDVVLISVVLIGATFILSAMGVVLFSGGTPGDGAVAAAAGGMFLYVVVVIALSVAYFPWFWKRNGATPGMKLFRLRVVRDVDGGPITTGQAVLRLLGYWVNAMVLYIGFAWVLVDQRRRGWHDLIAGTVVIEG